ncbi:MAG: glycosyltransferase family A protein [Ignavibacteria bacterium]|jgi:glycosyltransferase involved in cell wall biosynthesis
MTPLVSIIIPAYNFEKWIKATIESAIAQTWQNKEIIVIDDGSTDNTYHIAKQFESKILKVLTQENSGACVARNKALKLAQGDFIQWLDADDLLAHDKIEMQLLGSDNSFDSRVLHTCKWGYFYNHPSRVNFKCTKLWQDLSPSEWLQIRFSGAGCFMHTAGWLVSRRLTEMVGPWDERLKRNQDGEYFCRVVVNSELVKFHSKAVSYYRKGNLFSITMNKSKSTIESLDLSYNLCVNHLLSLEDNEMTRKACASLLQRFITKVHVGDPQIILKNQNRIMELGGEISFPTESKKFTIIKYIFGKHATRKLKNYLWNVEVFVRSVWDRFLVYIFKK